MRLHSLNTSFVCVQDRCFAAAAGGVRKNRTLTRHPSLGCCRVLAVLASSYLESITYGHSVLASICRRFMTFYEISTT